MSVVTTAEVKLALNKTLTVDDAELQDRIDMAERYFVRQIGPITGSHTVKRNGGGSTLFLPVTATEVTAVTYSDSTAIDLDDLDFDADTCMLHWNYNTAGYFTAGTRNVHVTYTADLADDHRGVIIDDVAGWFAATQRGGGAGPSFSSEGYELPYQQTPATPWPRIDALARSYPSIG